MPKLAQFYTKEKDQVRCLLCPRRCLLNEGQTGFCGVRRVVKGKLYTGELCPLRGAAVGSG